MSATLVARHQVNDFASWKSVYDSLEGLRGQHGCTGARVWQHAEDGNDVLITHDFPTVEQAAGFAGDPELKAGMARAGVVGQPQIEIFTVA
jgi:type II secretory pathway component PulJ